MKYITKQILITLIITFAIFLASSVSAVNLLKFEGKVTEVDGSELADGNYDFLFSLYDAPTSGSLIWQENLIAANMFSGNIINVTVGASSVVYTYGGSTASSTIQIGQYLSNSTSGGNVLIIDFGTSTITVASGSPVWSAGDVINNRPFVEGGVIDIDLGAVTDISSLNFSQDLYLEIVFNGETMQPRKNITQVASAFNSQSLGGMLASDFANLIDNQIVNGEWQFNNIVGIATSSTGAALTVDQNGTGEIVQFRVGGSDALSILNTGQMQIGNGGNSYRFPINLTGASSGYILKLDGAGNLGWASDSVGVSGGSGAWASSTNNLLIHPADTAHIVVIGHDATSSVGYKFEVAGSSYFDNVAISNGSELIFFDNSGSNFVSLKSTTTITSDYTITLPASPGSSGQVMFTDANGNLYWDIPIGTIYANHGNIGQVAYYASDGSVVSGTSTLTIDVSGNVGISTSTPLAELDVYGNIVLSGNGRYINFSNTIGNSGYGIRDNSGTIQVKNLSGTWTDVGAGATAFNDLNDVNVNGVSLGNLVYYNGLNWATTSTSTLGIALSDTTGILSVARGGTGLSNLPTYGQLLIGNGSGGYIQVSTSSLGLVDLETSGLVGQIPFFNSAGDTLTATSVIYIDTATGFVGIATTTPGKKLTVDGSGQFHELCFDDGSCISNWATAGSIDGSGTGGQIAVWNDANTLEASSTLSAYLGGTGKSAWAPLAIPYLQGTTTFGEINIGSSTYVLAVNASATGYEWVSASSTGVVLTQEQVDDYVDALINDADSVYTRINITYDDVNNAMDFVVDDDLNHYNWLNVDTTHLTPARGGTGWNSTGETGFAYLNGGTWSASNTISAIRLDSNVMLAGENISLLNNDIGFITSADDSVSGGELDGVFSSTGLLVRTGTSTYEASSTVSISYTDLQATSGLNLTGNTLTLDTSGNWSGTFDTHEGSYYLNAVNLNNFAIPFDAALASTTTDALSEGLVNLYWTQARFDTAFTGKDTDDLSEGVVNAYWTNTRFDNRLSATTSLPNITTLQSLQTVGTIATGTWEGDVLGVAFGGLGTSTYATGDMIFASAPNVLDKLTIGNNGLILQVVGGVPQWVSTSSLGIDFDAIGGVLPINKGGTGASTTAGALANLGLTEVEKFGINATGTAGWIWQSDGDGRGQWTATGTLGIGESASMFIGTTTNSYSGSFATGTLAGYKAANDICNAEFPGSHFCRTYDILVTVNQGDISGWGTAYTIGWVAEGPPGFTTSANDCKGWTDGSHDSYGAWWEYTETGGAGWLIYCDFPRPISCCRK